MTTDAHGDWTALQDGLRRAAVALTEAGVPFALVGGYAAWARGAPEPSHDADLAIAIRTMVCKGDTFEVTAGAGVVEVTAAK